MSDTVTLLSEQWLDEKAGYHQRDPSHPDYCTCGDSLPCDWTTAIAVARYALRAHAWASEMVAKYQGWESTAASVHIAIPIHDFAALLAEVRAPVVLGKIEDF